MKYAAIVKAPRQCKSFSSCSTCRTAVPGRDPSGDGEDSRARTATAAAAVLPSPHSKRHLLEDFCSFSGCQEWSLLRQLLLQCARQGVVALAHRTDCRVHRRQLCHRKKWLLDQWQDALLCRDQHCLLVALCRLFASLEAAPGRSRRQRLRVGRKK